MLRHPVGSTIHEVKRLAKAFAQILVFFFILLLVTFGVVAETFNQVGIFFRNEIKKPSQVLTIVGYPTLGLFGLAVFVGIMLAVVTVLRSWSRLGNSLALMMSVVALAFLTADAWRVAAHIEWWRLITFVCLSSIVVLPLLYRHAVHAVRGIDQERLKDPAAFTREESDQVVTKIASSLPLADISPHGMALFNLRATVTLLYARRILISGLIVSFALVLIGVLVINQTALLSLLNVKHLAEAGWSRSFLVGGHAFFLSEALLKVGLSLSGLAVVYFVVVTMSAGRDETFTTAEAAFIRKALALWSCYGTLLAALPVAEEAVTVCRELAATSPRRYRPDLAQSLANLSDLFSQLGRPADALPVAEEAVTVCRELAAASPRRYRPDLAQSLADLSDLFSRLGRPADALPVAEEAVTVCRELAAASPRRYRPDLAQSLADLSDLFSRLGRLSDALPVAEEAVAVGQELAASSPDGHSPDFAYSLDQLRRRASREGVILTNTDSDTCT